MGILDNLFGRHHSDHHRSSHGHHEDSRHGYSSGHGGPALGATGLDCSACRAQNQPNARFCQQCGKSLIPSACRQCGTTMQTGAKFCAQCGQPAL
ncbi:MAG: zinc-ribbon domain-containing protein [Rhodoferax sp.]|nr:MAG: zinc-ribbon domain-containing protein [Rhodoferax sp.]